MRRQDLRPRTICGRGQSWTATEDQRQRPRTATEDSRASSVETATERQRPRTVVRRQWMDSDRGQSWDRTATSDQRPRTVSSAAEDSRQRQRPRTGPATEDSRGTGIATEDSRASSVGPATEDSRGTGTERPRTVVRRCFHRGSDMLRGNDQDDGGGWRADRCLLRTRRMRRSGPARLYAPHTFVSIELDSRTGFA